MKQPMNSEHHDLLSKREATVLKHLRLPPLEIDQRQAERLPIKLPIHYTIEGCRDSMSAETITRNMSGGGVEFLIPRMVSPMTRCRLTLRLPQQTPPLVFLGHVSWCRQGRGKQKHQYEVGVVFFASDSCDEPTFARYCYFIATQLLAKHLT